MRPESVGPYGPNLNSSRHGGSTLSEEPDFLQARLGHARRRLDAARRYSPEWEAATEAVDDLKQRLERALSKQATVVALVAAADQRLRIAGAGDAWRTHV
jgi:hypothetical protein